MPACPALILEILKLEDALRVGLFEDVSLNATLRHYCQVDVSFFEIEGFCREAIHIINKTKFQTDNPEALSELRKIGTLLWEHLLSRQVKEKLKAAGPRALVLSIDEELINIPWEMLFDGKDFLCLKFDIGRLVRSKKAGVESRYRAQENKLKMLILANPTNDLKSAYSEGISIRNKLERKNKSVSVDFKSGRIDSVYIKKNLCDYDIVHFAGHCEYEANNARKSGWVLSDTVFSVQNILNMGQAVLMPALVFSNGCYSAREDNFLLNSDYQARNYSIASGFLFSGVRHYLGSISRIEDNAGAVFARSFYSQLMVGKSMGESTRLSRLELIKEYGKNNLHWLNYLLYGDPRFSFFKPKVFPGRAFSGLAAAKVRKKIKTFLFFGFLIILFIFILSLLPSLNPSSISLYLNSKKQFNKGNSAASITLALKALKRDQEFLALYPLLGDAYQRMGNKEEARQYYFNYAIYSEKKKNNKARCDAYLKLGWFYYFNGAYDKALDFYNQALKLSEFTKDKLNQARSLRLLAVWHIEKNDYNQALELLTKSSGINLENKQNPEFRKNLACDYFDIGLVFENKNDFPAAKEFYQKSKDLFVKLNLKNELSDCYFNLGEIYMFEKQYKLALEYYLSGLKIDEKQGNKSNLSGDYNMLGELYVEMDDALNAEQYFTQALSIALEIGNKPDAAVAYNNLGLLYKNKGKKNKARDYFRNAQEIYHLIDPVKYKKIKEQLLDLDTNN